MSWRIQPGICQEGKHVTSTTLIRKGLQLTGLSRGFWEMWVQFSHVFSYIISREISKGTWVHEDAETLICSEYAKFLVLTDAFFKKTLMEAKPAEGTLSEAPLTSMV